jgi:predicted HicB family RNase H-like nuclease
VTRLLDVPKLKPKARSAPESLGTLQMRIPHWLKSEAAQEARSLGKSLSDWIRDLMRDALDKKRARSR